MSHATTYPLDTRKPNREDVIMSLTGGGAADATNPDSAKFGGGEIVTAVRSGAGTFALTFRRKWPVGKFIGHGHVGTTAGLKARLTAFSPSAGTATLVLEVGAVATDPATTDTIHLHFQMGNTLVD